MNGIETGEDCMQASMEVNVWVTEQGVKFATTDMLAQETPVALVYNGITHAIMLATPRDLKDFALGFSLTEGLIDQASQIYGVEMIESEQGIALEIELASSCFSRLKEKRRNMAGPTGCGLCGTESLGQVLRSLPTLPEIPVKLVPSAIEQALAILNHHQPVQQQTGATHAAAWFNQNGEIQLVREDIGRHNALDKLIGAGLHNQPSGWRQGMLVITSRASLEMVQKAVIAGFHYLVALSAPTQLAVRLAQEHGLCLIGFARPGKWTIYCHPDKLA